MLGRYVLLELSIGNGKSAGKELCDWPSYDVAESRCLLLSSGVFLDVASQSCNAP